MQGHLVLWMRSKGVCLALGWMPSRVSWAWLPASALGALGLSSGPESEPWSCRYSSGTRAAKWTAVGSGVRVQATSDGVSVGI